MSVKAKTRKRLVILVAAVLGLGVAGGGLWAAKTYRTKMWYAEKRELGMRAAADGKSADAVANLTWWLHRNPNDVEALKAYTKHRLAAGGEDNLYVRDAMSRLRHLIELDPQDDESRRELMRLYAGVGMTTEAMDLATALLAKQPNDVDAMKCKLDGLIRLRKWDEANALAEGWAKAAPDDPEPTLRIMGVMAQADRPAQEILDRAKAAGAKDPNSPAAQVVLAMAYALTDDLPSAHKLMKLAAAQKPPTPAFARLLIAQLNFTGLFDESLRVIQTQAKESEDPGFKQSLVRRMWELNRAEDVLALTAQDAGTLGPEATAFRAIAYLQLGKREEAKQALAHLQSKDGDALAEAWATIVGQELEPGSVEPRKMLEVCQKAARKDSEGAYLRFFIGQAYAQLDEGELAINNWQQLAMMNRTWSAPLVRLSELQLAKGQFPQAMAAAQEGIRRSSGSPAAAVNLAKVWAAGIESGKAEQPDQLLELIGKIRAAIPREESTLSMQVSLLAKTGRKDEAKAEISKALKADPAPGEGTLLRFAAVSRSYDLGLVDACLDRSEQAHGLTANLAYARAINKFARNEGAEGLALLKAARERSGKADTIDWQLALARYLEVIQDTGAKDEWVRVGDANPDNRLVQQTVLDVRSARADRAFIDRSIERLRKLTGDEGVSWKLARARWLLAGAKNDQDRVQATTLLRDVIRQSDGALEPHVLLAQAYDQLKNPNGAVEELRRAAAIDPSNTGVALQLSRLLQKRGEFDKAREELDRVAKGNTADPAQRRQAAMLMAQQGDAKGAIDLLQSDAEDGKAGGNDLLLATLYRQRNELAKAEELVRKLLEKPEPAVIQFAADMYAQQGRRAEADQALALLDKIELKPGVKEVLLADHATRFQTPDRAIELFRAALKAAPDNAAAWRSLVGFYAFLGRGNEMASTAEEALKAVPGDATLKEVVARKDLLADADTDPETRPLVMSFLSDARADAPSILAIREIAASEQPGVTPDQVAAKLRKLVDQHPTYAPIQLILIGQYLRHGRADDAVELASRAVQMFPNDPEPARLATQAASSAGRWAEATGFARTWRERSLSNPAAADLAISSCLLQSGQARQAAEVLAPYVPQAVTQPERNATLIYQYATALNASGQGGKAADVLWPLAQANADWRKVWMQTSLSLPNVAEAAKSLERIETIVPADAHDERAVLAGAWHMLGEQRKDPAAVAKSKAMFDAVVAQPGVTANAVLAYGIAAEQRNDLPAAEAAYRRALSMDAGLLVAKNNLAMVILKGGGDPAEAVKFAKSAVEQQPRTPTLHDTLALAQAKGKDVDGAVASMRNALALEPNSTEWRLHLARILLDDGRDKDAAKVFDEIATLPAPRTPFPDKVKQEIEDLRLELSKKAAVTQTQ
jgi:predicted Zn-dependent protease